MELRLGEVVYCTVLAVAFCILLADVAVVSVFDEGSATDHGSEVVACIIRTRIRWLSCFLTRTQPFILLGAKAQF